MLGVSSMLGSSGESPAAGDGGAGPSSGEDERMKFEDSERVSGGGGNRWPRQETLALLKIRSDMDSTFKDSSLKAPLWDEVSRKLAELGYHRNAKKCKEKFENVFKYHKRTKDSRSTKLEGKTYRFFDQLEALDQNQSPSQLPSLPTPPHRHQNQGPESPTPVAMAMPTNIHQQNFLQVTVTSTPIVSTNVSQSLNTPKTLPFSNMDFKFSQAPPTAQLPPQQQEIQSHPTQFLTPSTNTTIPVINANTTPNPCLNQNLNTSLEWELGSSSPSCTGEEEDPKKKRNKKRKWGSFFKKLMSEVVQKQEQMQKDFLETLERREHDRVAREEAWRVQETARMHREHELLAQERSMAAAKDSAVIAYLQKISNQNEKTFPKAQTQALLAKENPNPNPILAQMPVLASVPVVARLPPEQMQIQPYNNAASNGISHSAGPASSSRWPKAEVEALIQIRTNMDVKYEENGPKGPMWEEVSMEMKKIGYDRSAKRCKEKWENINKYFKKVKESNKKRPEDSKTCPYFQLLDHIHRAKAGGGNSNAAGVIMAQPEQQWPQPLDRESDEMEGEDEGGDDRGGYEIVTNKGAEEHE